VNRDPLFSIRTSFRIGGINRQTSFCLTLLVLLFTLALPLNAQQTSKISKIGWLGEGGAGSGREFFRQALADLGYVEGKNLTIEYRYSEGRPDRLPALADELIRLKVDVLVTASGSIARVLKNATRTIPIVFLSVSDPVAVGLVDSLPRPGGNMTGFSIISSVLAGKRLELLQEIIPKLSRVAVLWNPYDSGSTQTWKESQLPARELGLQLHSMEIRSPDQFESGFKEAVRARSTALAVAQYPLAASNQKYIADLAVKSRLPAIYPRGDYAASGGMMSYGHDRVEPYRRGASMVDKILKGAKPADLPVEQPTKFELVINLKTAKQIGLMIPPHVLARADKVIR
jgi:putative tryptophan/tyrosine transport system substrate-binding protein